MATKSDGSIIGWAVCIVGGLLLFKHFSSPPGPDVIVGSSAARFQSDAAAAGMPATASVYDADSPIKVPPPGSDELLATADANWWLGPPLDWQGKPVKHPLPPTYVDNPFAEIREGPGPFWEPGVREEWPAN